MIRAFLKKFLHLWPALSIVVIGLVWGALASPHFLNAGALLHNSGRYMEIAILALAMTLVIIHGDIDLSVASNLGFSAAMLGLSHSAGFSAPVAVVVALITGTLLGAFNGFLVTILRLPALVVTLGTMALYRGASQIALGEHAITGYPESFVGLDVRYFLGLPLPLLIFLALVVGSWVLMEKTNYGIEARMSGLNASAVQFSGIKVARNRFVAFALSGLMAGVGAVLITSRLGSTLSNVGLGMELLVITVVVLGGTNIFGGYGTISGTVMAVIAVFIVREALAINNVNGQIQDSVIGLILALTISTPYVISKVRSVLERRKNQRTDGSAQPAQA